MPAPRAALPALLLAAALTTAAAAEHAVAYRYTVLGYVTDADGRARPGVRVELSREKTGLSYLGASGTDGFYVIVARLGDESAGETLSLRAGSQALVLTARFDPADHTTERGTRVDFTARRPLESPTLFAGTLKRFLTQ
ncbi:MAG: carboxypeptidase-like regulatory domain-containing protein [Candidatus Rokuibacteriota bacterium]